jgi:predicted ATPase/DNA-binding NarL/FixJ family response regulator/DNA-binding transcriptional regulator YiaG
VSPRPELFLQAALAQNPQPAFGQQLRRLRAARDLTQSALGELVGCSTDLVRKLESGARRPSRELAERIVRVLGLDPAEGAALVELARTASPAAPEPPAPEPPAPEPPALPPEPTPLVGREQELAELGRLLAEGRYRLVTVVGPGGMGKTRLALRAAHELAGRLAGGACWIALASVPAADLLPASIADALGLTFPVTADVEAHLLRHLAEREALLVLDNFEHLAEGAGVLSRLLAAAPRLRLLVTSRVRLNLREELVWELGGLGLPRQPAGRDAGASAAVALFAQSAGRARHDFALDPRDYPAVAQICAMVEGMPLGIELAAAWTRLLAPAEIAAELARGLDFLTTPLLNVEDRHRSLRAVFLSSWAMLAPEEQAIVRRLSVFQGGFTRDAAADVAGARLPQLLALSDKSFVRRTERSGGGWRFEMHELVRQYAAEQLAASSAEEAAARERHGRHYGAFLAAAEPELKGAGQQAALARCRDEIHNLRAAWEWLYTHRQAAAVGGVVTALAYFYELRAWSQEGERAFGRAADALAAWAGPDAAPEEVRALGATMLNHGWFLMRTGATERGLARVRESLALLRRQGDSLILANACFGLGYIATLLGRFPEARGALGEGLELARAADHPWMTAIILTSFGTMARAQGQEAEAAALLSEARAQWARTGEPRGTAWCLNELGALLLAAGRHDEAEATLQESLALSVGVDDPWSSGTAYGLLGQLACVRRQDEAAAWLLRQSLDLFRASDARAEVVHGLLALAEIALARGALGEARPLLREALQAAASAQLAPLVVTVVARIAALAAAAGDAAAVRELCALVLASPAATSAAREEAARLQAALPAPARAAQRGAPRAPGLDEAVAAGQAALRGEAANGAAAPAPAPRAGAPALAEPLTPREVEVLRLLAAGASNPEIAERLHISPHTAKIHVAHILAKLGAGSRTEAAVRARDLGLA